MDGRYLIEIWIKCLGSLGEGEIWVNVFIIIDLKKNFGCYCVVILG